MRLRAAQLLTDEAARAVDSGDAGDGRGGAGQALRDGGGRLDLRRAVQLHGGLGVKRGSVVERLYRDVRALRIYEGTSEIQNLVLARELLRERG